MKKELSDMNKDVAEYVQMEEKITKDFLSNLIKMGEILKRHRDKWKEERRYMEYLDKIGRPVSTTNQIIRIYEYSIKNMTKLIASNITDWNKVNMFLSLPDCLKDKLSEEINGEDIEIAEFREKITDVKTEDLDEESLLPIGEGELDNLITESSLVDIDFLAKQLIKEMVDNKVGNFTEKSEPIATGFLLLEKARRYLKSDKFKILSKEEKKFWNKAVAGQIDRLNKTINK